MLQKRKNKSMNKSSKISGNFTFNHLQEQIWYLFWAAQAQAKERTSILIQTMRYSSQKIRLYPPLHWGSFEGISQHWIQTGKRDWSSNQIRKINKQRSNG